MMAPAAIEFGPPLDTEEAVAMVKIRPKAFQRLARSGEISGVQVGMPWRLRVSSLNAWLEQKLLLDPTAP
jgi:excisionase family DNA binding protein